MHNNNQQYYEKLCQITDHMIAWYGDNEDDMMCFTAIKMMLDSLKGQSGVAFGHALILLEIQLEDCFEGTHEYTAWADHEGFKSNGKYAPFLINRPSSIQ